MATQSQRAQHEQWLSALTVLPTAAGREHRVIDWVQRWTDRRADLKLTRDKAGNVLIKQTGASGSSRRLRPLFITAHLDHPAFVVRDVIDASTVELEFRGGVQDAYFHDAVIEIIDSHDASHTAAITSLDSKAKPFKRVRARLQRPSTGIQPSDIGRWFFEDAQDLPRVDSGQFHTHACDDLAAVAAALATLDLLRKRKDMKHVGVLLTLAEEVGFIGAIAACKGGSVPKSSRLICLENSRSFVDSPIGAGPILRVGDRLSVFDPALTNRIGAILTEHAQRHAGFTWQRKLMPGGACEATAFSTYGYESTCICLPLGNYHNMVDIDGVAVGKRPARVGPEFISIDDYHGMIEMLVVCATQLDTSKVPDMRKRMDQLLAEKGFVLDPKSSTQAEKSS